jgi:GNAT superfamily N-acetyltransferase
MRFEVTEAPDGADLDALSDGLSSFNTKEVGPSEWLPLAIFIRGDGGEVTGGLSGYTAWGWLFTQRLWLGEELRGQRLSERLLQMAEDEALRRGCHGAWIDTFNPVALRVYERHGYAVFGTLPDCPEGHSRWFLQKRLS